MVDVRIVLGLYVPPSIISEIVDNGIWLCTNVCVGYDAC